MEVKAFTLPDLFDQSAPADTHKTLYFDQQGQEISYAIFYNRVELSTELLKKLGVKRGETIAILSDNLANWACAYFAIARAGGIALPLLPQTPDHDLALFLNSHEVTIAFTSASLKERLSHLDVKTLSKLITLENFAVQHLAANREKTHERLGRELERLKKTVYEFIHGYEEQENVAIQPEDPFCVLYIPDERNRWRPVFLSHRNIIAAALAVSQRIAIEEKHRIAVFLPLALTLPALLGILLPLLVNAQAVLLPKPENSEQLQKYLAQFQPTHLFVDAAFAESVFKETLQRPKQNKSLLRKSFGWLQALLTEKDKPWSSPKFAFPKKAHWLICTNFVPLGPQFKRFLNEQKIAHHLLFGHFQTASIFLTGEADEAFCWVQGTMLPQCQWRIEGPSQGAIGELYLQGPIVSLGKSPEGKNAAEFLPTGWAVRQKGDFIQVLGPLKHQIVLPSGAPIFPELIEATLNEFEWIAESLVYLEGDGLFVRVYPDPEKTKALVQRHPERLAIELLSKAKKRLPQSVQIKGLAIESEPFPKNVFGQLLRK